MSKVNESLPADEYVCIAPDVKLGNDVKLGKFINLYGCEIGDETKIGAFVEIQKNAIVGRRCKISSHTFICEGRDDRGPRLHRSQCDLHQRLAILARRLQAANCRPRSDWKVETTLVKKGASIGSGATILCNVVIGEGAIVGAGSVVTRDVPPRSHRGWQSRASRTADHQRSGSSE